MQSLVFFFKEKKNKLPDSLPESIEGIDLNEFIHKWLLSDPYDGFWNEDELSDQMVVLKDSLIWFLNMAYMYTECLHETTLALLEFGFHRYLRPSYLPRWKRKFIMSTEFEKEIQSQEAQFKGSQEVIPYWFTFVICRFLHGIDGTFGRVKLWSTDFESTFKKCT